MHQSAELGRVKHVANVNDVVEVSMWIAKPARLMSVQKAWLTVKKTRFGGLQSERCSKGPLREKSATSRPEAEMAKGKVNQILVV